MAHITGGGIIDNLPRILPPGTDAVIDITTWPNRSIFQVIQKIAAIEQVEMFKTFNMGIGMVVVVDHCDIRETMEIFANNAYRPYYIGEVPGGERGHQADLLDRTRKLSARGRNKYKMLNLGVLVSGSGTNLEAIARACEAGRSPLASP